MKVQLCRCNNCGTIMVDENPDRQPAFDPPDDVQDMLWVKEEGFWACPICKTDDYLADVETNPA